MANSSGTLLSVGTRHARIFALNANGRPAAASPTTPYTGLQLEGAKAFTVTFPEPRQISHSGDDRLLARDVLPPLEGATAELQVAKNMYSINALLQGIKVSTVGESVGIGYGTNLQGYEPQFGLMLYQQALDAVTAGSYTGLRRWRAYWFPAAKLIVSPPGMEENPAVMTYRTTPYVVTRNLWGTLFTTVLDGFTEAQGTERMTDGLPQLDNWLGDAIATVFTLSATALSTAKIAVFKNGVLITAGIAKTTTTVTFTVAPAAADDINIFYES